MQPVFTSASTLPIPCAGNIDREKRKGLAGCSPDKKNNTRKTYLQQYVHYVTIL